MKVFFLTHVTTDDVRTYLYSDWRKLKSEITVLCNVEDCVLDDLCSVGEADLEEIIKDGHDHILACDIDYEETLLFGSKDL